MWTCDHSDTTHHLLTEATHSTELTEHGGIAPVHGLWWGQRGLLGALRGGGWGYRWLLSGCSRRGDGPDGFGRWRGRGRGVLGRGMVGRGARCTLAARVRGRAHEPFWRHDAWLFRRQRFTQGVPKGFWVRDIMAVWLYIRKKQTQHHEDLLYNKSTQYSSFFSYYWISDISLWNTLNMVINVSDQRLGNEPFSAAQPLKALSVIALVWELHYLGISCEDKQSRRLQLPPKTNLPLCHPTAPLKPPHAAAPTPFLKATALKFRVIYLQMSFYHCVVIQP